VTKKAGRNHLQLKRRSRKNETFTEKELSPFQNRRGSANQISSKIWASGKAAPTKEEKGDGWKEPGKKVEKQGNPKTP